MSERVPGDELATRGYRLVGLALRPEIRASVEARDWAALDRLIAIEVAPGGTIFSEMRRHAQFESIEFIISIRSSREYPDDDGIWHDDGSRVRAFSLSLTLAPEEIRGGVLEVRRRDDRFASEPGASPDASLGASLELGQIPTPPFGTMIVFATGVDGFEHRIRAVEAGERVIIAGWCS